MAGLIREEFDVPLNDLGDYIRVRILRQGKQVFDFLAQYEALIDDVSILLAGMMAATGIRIGMSSTGMAIRSTRSGLLGQ